MESYPVPDHSNLPELVGDGSVDETDAVQEWFNAGVPLPKGIYAVSGKLTVNSITLSDG